MRSGNWRGVVVALGVASALWIGLGTSGMSAARADGWGFNCTIPDLVPAINLDTGQRYYAPAVPYGSYAGYDWHGMLGGLMGLGHGLGAACGACGGAGCGACGAGHGACGACGGVGCAACGGAKHGLCLPTFSHKPLCFPSLCIPSLGIGCPKVAASSQCLPSKQCAAPVIPCAKPSIQCATPSIQCAKPGLHCALPGCGFMGKHGLPGCCMTGAPGVPCANCGGAGCGACGGAGVCCGAGLHGGLGAGALAGLLPSGVRWFRGAGGPVPLTPGYVPYVVTTRSPRDFFAFPPMNPDAP
jgi:hypothetical protein